MITRIFAAALLAVCLQVSTYADIVLNEVLGSTIGADTEFIELFNSGGTAVDISNWWIREYESDSGGSFGNLDDEWQVADGTTLNAGGFYLIANTNFTSSYSEVPNQVENLTIENSSYTLGLFNTADELQYSAFVTDGGAGDAANIAGTVVTPDISVGPDGTFLPAGYYLTTDGGASASILEFSTVPAPSATPGASNGVAAIPEPSFVIAMCVGFAGVSLRRRRR